MKWNRLVVRLAGNDLEHWHNGKLVIDLVLGTPEWKRLVAASKFSGREFTEAGWGTEKTGQICLQDHGEPMYAWFRNIKIRAVDPATPVTAPAAPATGWRWHGSEVRFAAPTASGARIEFIPVSGGRARAFHMRAGGDRMEPVGLPSGVYVLRVTSRATSSRGLVQVP